MPTTLELELANENTRLNKEIERLRLQLKPYSDQQSEIEKQLALSKDLLSRWLESSNSKALIVSIDRAGKLAAPKFAGTRSKELPHRGRRTQNPAV